MSPPGPTHPDHGELGPDERPRKVRMSPDLMVRMTEAATGRRVEIDWGEPDADGFYTPTITTLDMRPLVKAARARLAPREDVEDGFVDPRDPDVTVL